MQKYLPAGASAAWLLKVSDVPRLRLPHMICYIQKQGIARLPEPQPLPVTLFPHSVEMEAAQG